jgi:hypothetical protein
MFAVAILDPDNEEHYWTGEEEPWVSDVEEAAIFYEESYAKAAIEILRRAIPKLSPTVHVVELEDENA